MESWLVARGMASGLWLTGGQTGTLAFEPLIMGYVGFISLDSLIHLLWSQLASILGYLRVQNMSYFLMDSVQGILIIITIVHDAVSLLPEGAGHIMSMAFLAFKFRNLDLTQKSILLLTPSHRGVSTIGVTATLAAVAPPAPTPPMGGV